MSTTEEAYRDLHRPASIIGGCFAAAAICLSVFLILQHLRSYNKPTEQKWIVGVLFMVPVYATQSIIALWNAKFSLVCETLRSCYEAFALYSFGSYLVASLGGERTVVEFLENESRKHLKQPLLEKSDDIDHNAQRCSFWKFFRQPSIMGRELYVIEKFGLVQYMILKTVCAFLAFLLELFGLYGDGEFKFYYGYPYIAVVLNFSQMWALFCLVQFYNVTHERLQEIKPLAKFISFKAIVFATWWQGVGIALLCYLHVLPKEGEFQNGLQNFLICIEMAIAAVAHIFVFPAEPYHYVTASEYGKITTETAKTKVKINEGGETKPALVEKTETQMEAPETSIRQSVQDIVVDGGETVMKDVVLTINQAMGPVEKGVTKINETIHEKFLDKDGKQEAEVEIDEQIEENAEEKV